MTKRKISDESQKTKSKIRELLYRLDNRVDIDYNKLTKLELVKKCHSYESSKTMMLDTIKKLRLQIAYYQRLDVNNSKFQLGVEIKRLRQLINELEIENSQLKWMMKRNDYKYQ
jgi:hypothetical protein